MSMSHHSKYGHNYQVGKPLGLDKRDIASLENALPALFADALTLSQQQPRADAGGAGGGVVQGIPPSKSLPLPSADSQFRPGGMVHPEPSCAVDAALKCDGELARIAMALKLAIFLRIWLILHELARLTGKQGFTADEFLQKMQQLGIKHEAANVAKHIHRGHGLFWQLDGNTGMIYPAGVITLCKRLVQRAYTYELWDIFITNGVGRCKDMYLDVSGTLDDFEAAILAGWHASKNNPTISRFVLTNLFRRDVRTMRKLEKRAGIKTVNNMAHTYDPALVPTDEYGNLRWDVQTYTDRAGRTVYAFTMSNTYHAPRVRQHPAWGQSRRARYVIDNLIEKFELPSSERGAGQPGKLNPDCTRQYFETAKGARSSHRKFGDQPRHVPLGADDGNTVHWQLSYDGRTELDFWDAADGISNITLLYNASYKTIESEQPF